MPSDLKNGTVWTPPTFTDDGSREGDASYLSAGGTHGLNAITSEILAAQVFAANASANVANVRDFGAAGNGTTDDRAAIQAALDSPARYVFFPPGTYRCNDTIVAGTGGTTGKVLFASGVGRSSAHHTKIVWGGSNQKNTADKALLEMNYGFGGGIHGLGFVASDVRHAILIRNGSDGWVEDSGISDLIFWGVPFSCIKAKRASNLTVRGLIFDNVSEYGIEAEDAWSWQVLDNCFFNRMNAGIRFYGTDGDYGRNHVIGDNTFWLCGSAWPMGGLVEPLDGAAGIIIEGASRGINVTGNIFSQNASGVIVKDGGDSNITGNLFDFHQMDAIRIVGARNVMVSGNVFRGSEGTGDRLDGYGHQSVLTSGTCRGITVVNNSDYDDWSGGVTLGNGTTYSVVDNYLHQGGKTVTNNGGGTNTVGRVVG